VVRVAGNVVDAHALASIEYAVEHLHSARLVVMGHERCGAVQAAVDSVLHPAPGPQGPRDIPNANVNLHKLIGAIVPAVRTAMAMHPTDLVDAAVRVNINNTMGEILKRSPIVSEKIDREELTMVGAYYDLDDGTVRAP
jgi:carbonic anhydrase